MIPVYSIFLEVNFRFKFYQCNHDNRVIHYTTNAKEMPIIGNHHDGQCINLI